MERGKLYWQENIFHIQKKIVFYVYSFPEALPNLNFPDEQR